MCAKAFELTYMESQQTDWDAVARAANVKTSKYARDQWAIVRNKLCGGGKNKTKGDDDSPAKTPVKSKTTGRTPPSRKRRKREGKTFSSLEPSSL
jgi:hypothetical protein